MANLVICERESLEAIADVIRNKTGSADTLSLDDMPTAIAEIGKGADNEAPDPIQVYKETRPSDWLPMPTPNEDEMYLLFHIPDGASSLLAFKVVCTGNYSVELGTVNSGVFVPTSSTSLPSESIYEAELFSSDFGNLTSDGNKQVMVKVSGTNITQWEPYTHTKKSSPANYISWNIVEISCNLPNGERVYCGNSDSQSGLKQIRYFSWQGENALNNASYMFSNCSSLTAILMLDTQKVTDMSYMFYDCYSLITIPMLDTQNVTNMYAMFWDCSSLTAIPMLNTQKVTNMSFMFYYCHSLITITMLDTQNVTNMTGMFSDCYLLTAIPMLNTQRVTSMSSMFSNCYSLPTIPMLDTQKVTNMSNMFTGCSSLTVIPMLNTQKVTNMNSMFRDCKSLTTIPMLDTQKVTDMSYMFYDCYSLITIPMLDTQNVTKMYAMFTNCRSLAAIPILNTQKVTSMYNMFYNCSSLTAISMLDPRNVTNISYIFDGCYSISVISLNPMISNWKGISISLKNCSLGHTALVQLFNSLPTITSSYAITLTGNPGVSELTDSEKPIATEKGWTLTL